MPGEERICNTTIAFDRKGEEIARYRKIHLFDIVTPGGQSYRESATYESSRMGPPNTPPKLFCLSRGFICPVLSANQSVESSASAVTR